MPLNYATADEVRACALALREKHDAMDWSANVDYLIRRAGITQGRYTPRSAGLSLKAMLTGVAKKIKALLSVKEQLILTSTDIHQAREAFAKGHELGHATLPWHRDILYVCDEHDLSRGTREQMEWEANTFASEVLIPRPLLAQMYDANPTTMETVINLSQLSGASIESCAFAYASNHPRKCVLLKMQEKKEGEKEVLQCVRKAVSNAAARSVLGTLTKTQTFESLHVLFQNSRAPNTVSACYVTMESDPAKRYYASLFNNSYNVFALISEESP